MTDNPPMTPAERERIRSYLDATTGLPARADLIFVFGTRLPEPGPIAVELWRRGIAPHIVFTGGPNRVTGIVEAHAHRDFALAAGVPASQIIVEDRSTNSHENVQGAIPLIEAALGGSRAIAVIAVCKWMHSRRALMTLKAGLPAGGRYWAHSYAPEGISRDNWWQVGDEARSAVLKNWQRLPDYLERGHVAEIARDGDAWV